MEENEAYHDTPMAPVNTKLKLSVCSYEFYLPRIDHKAHQAGPNKSCTVINIRLVQKL
jgi:hypothetical protein